MSVESNVKFVNRSEALSKGVKPLKVLTISLAVIIIAVIVLFFAKGFEIGKAESAIDFEDYKDFGHSWYYFDDTTKIPISHVDNAQPINKKTVTIYKTLSVESNTNNTIFFLSEQQAVRVSIDSDVIFEYAMDGVADPQNIIGNNYCVVKLPSNSAGKTLSIQYVAVNDTVRLPSITIGSDGSALSLFLQQRAASFLIIAILFALSIGLFIMFSAQKGLDSESSLTTIYLSFLLFLVCIWMLSDSQLLQLIIKNGRLIELIKYYTFMIMPIPYLLFLKGVCPKCANVFYFLSVTLIMNLFLISFLYLTGIMGFEISLTITISLISVIALILLVVLYFNVKKSTQVQAVFYGTMLFFATIAILFSSYRFGKGYIFLCQLSLALYLIFLSYFAWRKNRQLIREHVHFNLYKRMAYTDTMTGVGNRAAYDQRLTELGKGDIAFKRIAIIIADLNRTKDINDNYGNEIGDRLIVALAMCMQTASGGMGECFRIGGDEFALIFVDDDVPENAVEKLENAISKYNQNSEFTLSAACGYIDEKVTQVSPMV
ncbi:MAG: diguanylate cyclase, partial [Clostridiales bacterium]|nr:diguanylate cyclase [Clostridiales bacterium]